MLQALKASYRALHVFNKAVKKFQAQADQDVSSIFPLLVHSRVLLVLARIADWLQKTLQPAVLDFVGQDWVGAGVWHQTAGLLATMVGFLSCCTPAMRIKGSHYYPQLCAQLLASGEPLPMPLLAQP